MARITAESMMAPGGILDASSRLVQTLMEVPAARERFRKGLDEKAAMIQREDDRIGKTDKVKYLTDRISTVQQRIRELRNSMALGDTNETKLLMTQMRNAGTSLSGWASSEDHKSFNDRVAAEEARLRKEVGTKLGVGFAAVRPEQIESELAEFRQNRLKEFMASGGYAPAKDPAMAGLNSSSLELAEKDPQLQQELDQQLDQQDQLFDQYRRLVGQTEDIQATKRFLEKNAPGLAPTGKALTAAPLTKDPSQDPSGYPAPEPTVRKAVDPGSQEDLAAKMNALTDQSWIDKFAGNIGGAAYHQPETMNRISELAMTQAPALNDAINTATQRQTERKAAGLDTRVVDDKLGQIQNRSRDMLAMQLAIRTFGPQIGATPQAIELARAMLGTVHSQGVNMATQQAARPAPLSPQPSYLTTPSGLGPAPLMPQAPLPSFMDQHLVPRLRRISGGMPLASPPPVR